MVSILAISVSDKIEQYGAYAGFASVLGLAVLSLLYFAQAREVKRLREWAGRSPERAADLQDRVQADAQRRAAAVPQAPQARHLPGHPATGPQQPATAAGQAGQGAAVAAPAAAAAATAAGAATKAPAAPGTPPAPGAQPTTVQPAATAAGNGTPPGPVARPGQPLRVPGAQTPPPSTARAASAAADDDDGPRRPLAAILAGVAAIAVVVVLLVVFVFNGGKDDNGTPAPNTIGAATPTTTTGAASKAPASATTLKPGAYTVAVLNGTTTPGLARGVANRLQGAKFKTGTVTNAADQSHSATLVQYAPAHKGEALAVAKAIDVKSDAIQPLDQGARSLAGTDALVVVTVGQDQNQSPQQTP